MYPLDNGIFQYIIGERGGKGAGGSPCVGGSTIFSSSRAVQALKRSGDLVFLSGDVLIVKREGGV